MCVCGGGAYNMNVHVLSDLDQQVGFGTSH